MKVLNVVPDKPFSNPSNFDYPKGIKDYLISSYTIGIKNPSNDYDKSLVGKVYIFNTLKWLNAEYLNKQISKDVYIVQYNRINDLQKTDTYRNDFVDIKVEFITSDNKKIFTSIDISSNIGDYSVDYPPVFNKKPSDELVLANVFGTLPKYWKSVYGIDGTIWDLKANIDNPPVVTPIAATLSAIAATPSTITATSSTSTKINLTIVGLGDDTKVQAKTDISDFLIYIGDEPKPEPDVFTNLPELDGEYIEEPYVGQPDNVVDLDQEFASFPESNVKYNDNDSITSPFIEKSMVNISDSSKKQTLSNKQLTLIREKTSGKGVIGTMYFNGEQIALTLERPFDPPQNKNANFKCITAGCYDLTLDSTSKAFIKKHYVKFPESSNAVYRSGVAPRINKVPNQLGIRIHGGSTMKDSLGCVLVSNKRKSNGNDIVYDVSVTQYISKLIYSKNITKILIINEFN